MGATTLQQTCQEAGKNLLHCLCLYTAKAAPVQHEISPCFADCVGSPDSLLCVPALTQHSVGSLEAHAAGCHFQGNPANGTSFYNNLCRIMAESLNAVIVSIEYRLVPEVHFPEQFYDTLRATKYFLRSDILAKYSVNPDRIAISGDSAGGNLAAAVCQQLSLDDSVTNKLKLQALIYPVLQALDFNTPSYQQNTDMPVLPRFVMVKFWIDYFNGNYDFAPSMLINNHTSLDVSQAVYFRGHLNWTSLLPSTFKKNYKPVIQPTGKAEIIQEIPALLDIRAAPLLAEKEMFQLQPKTYILTCENDVLRDDGIMYAKRLESAGVEVTLDHFDDCFHGCMIFTIWPTNFSSGHRTRDSYIKWLAENL
ncbi:neutral cholesterol ester hydrolase 1 isoform X2 [Gopherus flavomarginatus]|uniref:neutral cholesterol ester hydrolase 1 isoform X2 n=1 Tax=Gopherus flavomarginatus TaxID=286002 RepID=UPI0021CBEFFF|nr:neutral cholesterol ester hydrolase 1 isoform X2 [Gopherus flavomarginatus]